MIQLVSAINGHEFRLTDAQAEQLYQKFGYVPGNSATDNGADENEVLHHWLHNLVDSHRLYGTATVSVRNLGGLRQAIWLFGTVYFGIDLPALAENQTVVELVRVRPHRSKRGSWLLGRTCGVLVGPVHPQHCRCDYLGSELVMTDRFLQIYVAEAHVPLIGDWIGGNGKCLDGSDLPLLQRDLTSMGPF